MGNENFKLGDVVFLNSGGPAMTVESLRPEGGKVGCRWFGEDKAVRFYEFHDFTLRKPTEKEKQNAINVFRSI